MLAKENRIREFRTSCGTSGARWPPNFNQSGAWKSFSRLLIGRANSENESRPGIPILRLPAAALFFVVRLSHIILLKYIILHDIYKNQVLIVLFVLYLYTI